MNTIMLSSNQALLNNSLGGNKYYTVNDHLIYSHQSISLIYIDIIMIIIIMILFLIDR